MDLTVHWVMRTRLQLQADCVALVPKAGFARVRPILKPCMPRKIFAAALNN